MKSGAANFLSIGKYMPHDDFPEPPRRADSKNPIPFLAELGSGSPLGPGGQSRKDFTGPSIEPLGGGGGRGLYRPPPPPEVESLPTKWS